MRTFHEFLEAQLDLSKPTGSKKVRAGFQPHWRTTYQYKCPNCGKDTSVYANSFRGKTPTPGVGAISCPHCPKQ